MKLFIKQEYDDLSPPKSAQALATLEASCLETGIISPIIHDAEGAILDGMHRFRIAEKYQLPFYRHLSDSFESEEAKKQWILQQALTNKKFSKHQTLLSRYKLMQLEPGETVSERAARLAARYPVADLKVSTVEGWFTEAFSYGRTLESERLDPEIYQFVWSGGAMTKPILVKLATLAKEDQRRALKFRVETGKSWKQCIASAVPNPDSPEGMQTLIRLLRDAKKYSGSLKRWVQIKTKAGDDVHHYVPVSFRKELEDFEKSCAKLVRSIENEV